MKVCPKCSLAKKLSEFYSRGKATKRVAAMCKSCFNTYCMERWKARKIKAIESFGNKCFDCNQTYHPNVYDFHHLYDKDYDWSKLRLRNQTTIDKELSKCVLLCANCHRIRHIE